MSDGINAHLVLIGGGSPDAHGTLQRVKDRIRTLGLGTNVRIHGPERDVGLLFHAMDVVVQASASEGLPNALLEASAAGRTVVATDVGGTREIVDDGRTGILVDAEDRGALTRALRDAATDPVLRRRLGANARAHVARAFTIERFVRQYSELYESVARSRVGGSP